MLTKYELEIDGVKADIPKDCIKNWEEIKCAYKRSDLGGITRSFTSKFEFVGEIYDRILELYLRDGFSASATLTILTLGDDWQWEERFAAPLDFSSLSWDGFTLSVNCIDNSLGALIKANKGTKYELGIGKDVNRSTPVAFDRLTQRNTVNFQIIGETVDDSPEMILYPNTYGADGSVGVSKKGGKNRCNLCDAYIINEDVAIGGMLILKDQSAQKVKEKAKNWKPMIEAQDDCSVTVEAGISFTKAHNGITVGFTFAKSAWDEETETYLPIETVWSFGEDSSFGKYRGVFETSQNLPKQNVMSGSKAYVKETETLWRYSASKWSDTGKPLDYMEVSKTVIQLNALDRLFLYPYTVYQPGGDNAGLCTQINIQKQLIRFTWVAKGQSTSIDTIRPADLCDALLEKMTLGKINAKAVFSTYDSRLINTRLLAGDSILGAQEAKISSSFNEFATWMSVVFGYTYYLGEQQLVESTRKDREVFHFTTSCDESRVSRTRCQSGKEWRVYFLTDFGVFAVKHADDGRFYTIWDATDSFSASTAYNVDAYHARQDKIFVQGSLTGSPYMVDSQGQLKRCSKADDLLVPVQEVRFVHRSELFNPGARVIQIDDVRDVSYSVDSSNIYAAVTIGYDKKSYGEGRGGDEFNVNNTYSTRQSVNDATLSLISKYRADSYGIETLAQKQGSDSKSSDSNVFFILTQPTSPTLTIDRTATIVGVEFTDMFNGAFTPARCVEANRGYIGMQAGELTLEFSSSQGNSSAVINGRALNADIVLNTPLLTCGRLTFTCDDVDLSASIYDLVQVQWQGATYRGYIEEATYHYANNEAVKYKLLIKEIEL